MPTSAHELPALLLRLDPALADWVRTAVFGEDPPPDAVPRLYDPNIRPRTLTADTAVVHSRDGAQPSRVTVYEVQHGHDPGKLASWKAYAANLEAELGVTAALIVHTGDPALADWYRRRIDADTDSAVHLTPLIFAASEIPLQTDPAAAATRPAPVLLAAAGHLHDAHIEDTFPALLAALTALPPDQKIFYHDQIAGRLPEAALARWEAFLMTTTTGQRYLTARFNEIDAAAEARGKTEGKTEGKAEFLLLVLDNRQVLVPDTAREQILTCTDTDQLERWLRRALTATTIDDVLTGDPSEGGA
jgi:hypothetical protein